MTDHLRLQEKLAYYRNLPPDERREVDAHRTTCAECQATWNAYRRQDAALANLPGLRPQRSLRPRPESRPRQVFGRLGEALALGGVGAMVWLFALQVQRLSQGALTPANPQLEPGLALPPTVVLPPTPWLPALPWVGAALLFVGGLFIFSRRSYWPTIFGALAAGLLLISFIPPLSAVPNPLGVYWRAAGGYTYDPRLPFKNDFLLAGRPDAQLRPYLDGLIGQVGLSPLDPVQPLAGYEILQVGLHPRRGRTALVTTRFIYADGSSRIYPAPLFGPSLDIAGFWLAFWREDGLARLRSEHLSLPGQPFADGQSALRILPAHRLDLAQAANRLDEANPGHWRWDNVRSQRLVWRPDGGAFLLAVELDAGQRQLWRVELNGNDPTPIGPAGDVREYGWTPDGSAVVVTRADLAAAEADYSRPNAIVVIQPGASRSAESGRGQETTLVTALPTDRLPGLSAEGAWFINEGALWAAPFDGQPARLVRREAADPALTGAIARPTTDGARVAVNCKVDRLCVYAGSSGELQWQAEAQASDLSWSADGSRLAVIDRDPNDLRPVRLTIFDAAGGQLLSVEIAPREATDPPQWTPDNRAVLVQTYPFDGRRIIGLYLSTGQVLDLSQEHWDAYFALAPDGQHLLLNNGRGDFWLAPLVVEK